MNANQIKIGKYYIVKHSLVAPSGSIFRININVMSNEITKDNEFEISAARFKIKAEEIFEPKDQRDINLINYLNLLSSPIKQIENTKS